MTVKLYVEGGGDAEYLHRKCRQGFRVFLERAGLTGRMPRIVACGSRQSAYDRYKTALNSGESAFLLIDSEDPVSLPNGPWKHLELREGDGFSRPDRASDSQCHLMVVCMESWFLADKEALGKYFGQGFRENALPMHSDIEAVLKSDLYKGMEAATSQCNKGPYGKGKHSFEILAKISPTKVRQHSQWAERLFVALEDN